MKLERLAQEIDKCLKPLQATARLRKQRYVHITYGNGSIDKLTKQEAEEYLAWLKKGNLGTYLDMLKKS